MDRNILAIDLKSFYASCECLDRGLDPFKTPLVVADADRGDGTIVLAASPYIKKKYGVKSRCRLNEVPLVPNLIIAQPKMKRYLEVSALINDIYSEFVSEEDLFVYSIDESFLDVTKYLKRNNDTAKTYARKIVKTIKDRTGLTVTCGIGLNLFMAKAAMDIEAKKNACGIAEWDYSSIPTHLWNVTPLSEMWGIGKRLEKRLNALGFYSVGDIATSDSEYLKKELGVIGEEIYYHSLGYDDALLQEAYSSKNRSISAGQVLLRDYSKADIPTLINDMALELSDRLYDEDAVSKEFSLTLGDKDCHFQSKKIAFYSPIRSSQRLSRALLEAYEEMNYPDSTIFRHIYLVALDVSATNCYQLSLFEDYEEESAIRKLDETLRDIRRKYGSTKAMPCSAKTFSSTYLTRRAQIGGHHA